MGHDIDIVNIRTNECISRTYITFNYTKYADKYPCAAAIHGHKNSTVIKILRKTLDLLQDDGIVPISNRSIMAITYGDEDQLEDLRCYATCLQEFLSLAFKIKRENDSEDDYENIYWYSDQVWNITKFKSTDGYESDGKKREPESDPESDPE